MSDGRQGNNSSYSCNGLHHIEKYLDKPLKDKRFFLADATSILKELKEDDDILGSYRIVELDCWLPISTIPKDGSYVLVVKSGINRCTSDFHVPEIIRWSDRKDYWEDRYGNELYLMQFKYWKPLPKLSNNIKYEY